MCDVIKMVLSPNISPVMIKVPESNDILIYLTLFIYSSQFKSEGNNRVYYIRDKNFLLIFRDNFSILSSEIFH